MSPYRTHRLNGPDVSGTPALITCFFMVVPLVNELRHQCPVSEVRDTPAAHSDTNFGNKGHWQLYGSGAAFDLKVLFGSCCTCCRTFKSAAPVVSHHGGA